ncbi:hypothetical protein ACFV42_42490 [Streptomyces solisilvae]|uniref:hypothetical protein n=1 Tax=Streptomyces malaysiensis TaxID=92644 RepID=UPI00367FAC02
MPTAEPTRLWRLILAAPGVRREIPYPTQEAVYAEAMKERDRALSGQRSLHSMTNVTFVRILHWNAGRWEVHARSWRMRKPDDPDALRPLHWA